MSRCRVAVVLVALTTVAMLHAAAQTPVFRTGIDLATFGITVIDRKGEFLTDLTTDDFEVLEDGQKQTIKYFARGADTETGPEMHVGLLFDTSGSMSEDIKLSRSAAVKFLNTLSDAKDMTLEYAATMSAASSAAASSETSSGSTGPDDIGSTRQRC